jgi:DNA-binding NtrC family response regulator
VLVLDDDHDFCELLQMRLERAVDLDCIIVHAVAELVAHESEALACELAILDVNLGPGAPTGIDAFSWLRTHDFGGAVVFLTGHARGHPLLSQLTEGAGIEVLTKPVEAETLISLLSGNWRDGLRTRARP